MLDLAFIWAMLLAVAILVYVILDGFDLGVGILFPFLNKGKERDVAMSSIAPVWDGNETWLVLGGGGLFAAFPLAYAVLMPAFYTPIIIMLLGLIFRGVAFEFRWRDPAHQKAWDYSFALGSVGAALCQGIILGAFIQGIAVEDRAYAGGWFDWITPFSLVTGVALVIGYALLGACWLILKSEDGLQDKVYRFALPLALGMLLFIAAVSLWTPMLSEEISGRWFRWPNIAILWPVPVLVAGLGLLLLWSIRTRREKLPFPLALGLFLLSYIGLGISLYPYVVPRQITLWEAAADHSSLAFMLAGAVILLPLILAYTGYAYWVFRGKASEEDHY
ncbi:cytochrome d ubiquinol oxidase subunit II [Emcibacter nanhaiensis]|uniref:Cytochrome d ubiquinol oxidase subunit II n=1 Tax=Emcibacter nanhaiensis TaxID=1505037 RepID=A0A501PMQ9_9PROT|nr:cytochrome d ubiquinol oxidase subunit II [Emcibacter nanhaiensis]TPD61733.1 cytochrome d ubiquinol oxidase subunit II [Emcibacter nanhaiensis]